ncbi:MAG TPA: BT4734/BF3469 family protein, partial [Candidatus Rifleibacterium sp.]|nr:BT4734/BF3469 family protein [Candidatus Rifleibacterium sp.]
MQIKKMPAVKPTGTVNTDFTTGQQSLPIFDPVVSLFRGGIKQTGHPENVRLSEVARIIETDPRLAALHQQVFQAIADHGYKSDPHKAAKSKLWYITGAGTFSHRADAGLQQSANLVQCDLDGLNSDGVQAGWNLIKSDPFTALMFISPSQNGLKWFARANFTDKETYKAAWLGLQAYYREMFFIKIDPNARPMSQPCYLSAGKVYLNPHPEVFQYSMPVEDKLTRERAPTQVSNAPAGDRTKAIVEAAFRNELQNIIDAPKGQGSRAFNVAVLSLASYFHTGAVDEKKVEEEFCAAFKKRGGHSDHETARKFADAWQFGLN